jgi:mRNA interferase RelE/StbE
MSKPRCFQSLEKNPREGNNIKSLKGMLAGSYRSRVGDLRIVYTINDRAVTVFVITIAKRSDVYG